MQRKIFSLALCLMAALTMSAQEEAPVVEKPWKFDGTVGLNAAATGLINWSAGGKNNMSGFLYAKLHLLYSNDVIAWESNLDTDFGLTWTDQKEDPLKKSTDNIKFSTKFGWEFHKDWYLTLNGSFQSQYAIGRKYKTGYDPIMSKWLAPSYTDISVGIDWKKSYKGADFSVYLSPIAGRITTAYIGDSWNKKYTFEKYVGELDDMVREGLMDQATRDGLVNSYDYDVVIKEKLHYDVRSDLQYKMGTFRYADKDMTVNGINYKMGDPMYRNARAELGLSFKGSIAYAYKDLKLSTTIGLFTPYQGKGFNLKDAWLAADNTRTEADWDALPTEDRYYLWSNKNRYFGHFDVDWDFSLSYQFLKCLQVTLSTSLKYYNGTMVADQDGNWAERVQFKGIIGLGVGYSF